LGGQASLAGEVLVYDENGQHQAPTVAEFLAGRGLKVTLAMPDRMPAIELGATNSARFMRELYGLGVRMLPDHRLTAVRREGNRLTAHLRNSYTLAHGEHRFDHVVVEHGTLPADELYHALKPGSRNRGQVDIEALTQGRPQPAFAEAAGGYLLYRVGDAVASRNIHAAIYDSLRLLKDL
jgi:NADPH-dependent 2,4-dienoyl-CoA reductase/sulfur reductase-like enzyme